MTGQVLEEYSVHGPVPERRQRNLKPFHQPFALAEGQVSAGARAFYPAIHRPFSIENPVAGTVPNNAMDTRSYGGKLDLIASGSVCHRKVSDTPCLGEDLITDFDCMVNAPP